MELSPEESHFYNRQIRLNEVGVLGQVQLKKARVLVVGAGALGTIVLSNLVGAGVGTIGLIDDDEISVDNLHRQILYGLEDVGSHKVTVAAKVLAAVIRTSILSLMHNALMSHLQTAYLILWSIVLIILRRGMPLIFL